MWAITLCSVCPTTRGKTRKTTKTTRSRRATSSASFTARRLLPGLGRCRGVVRLGLRCPASGSPAARLRGRRPVSARGRARAAAVGSGSAVVPGAASARPARAGVASGAAAASGCSGSSKAGTGVVPGRVRGARGRLRSRGLPGLRRRGRASDVGSPSPAAVASGRAPRRVRRLGDGRPPESSLGRGRRCRRAAAGRPNPRSPTRVRRAAALRAARRAPRPRQLRRGRPRSLRRLLAGRARAPRSAYAAPDARRRPRRRRRPRVRRLPRARRRAGRAGAGGSWPLSGPHSFGSGTPGGSIWRRLGPPCPDSPGSFAPGHALATRAARTKSLRSGWPSKPSGSSSGARCGWPAKSTPNISCVSRSCQAAPA